MMLCMSHLQQTTSVKALHGPWRCFNKLELTEPYKRVWMNRPTIYSTAYFQKRYEIQARKNLQHAIAVL